MLSQGSMRGSTYTSISLHFDLLMVDAYLNGFEIISLKNALRVRNKPTTFVSMPAANHSAVLAPQKMVVRGKIWWGLI